ncbi:DUF6493 family protein, partial [[Pseudopropionibacterium] massiliense]|uniref:DUF7824 domain-containing protein n=1 Tax=[Pseudopropionibacterium] massiliense TaxID=2220000 RepID=UPI0013EF0324
MTDRELTPEEADLVRMTKEAANLGRLIEELESMDPEERASRSRVLKKGRRTIKAALTDGWWIPDARLMLLTAALGSTPAQTAATFGLSTVTSLQDEDAIDEAVALLADRGADWVEKLVAALLRKRDNLWQISHLVGPLCVTLGLPLPGADHTNYWTGWSSNNSDPTPGTRWQEHFLQACESPNALTFPGLGRDEADIREKAKALREREPTNDPALLDALLRVVERGDRPTAQQAVAHWLRALNLEDLLPAERHRLLAGLPNADKTVVKLFTGCLLADGLGDDDLTALALDVLVRKEKGVKRDVLKALRGLGAPSQDLVGTVEALVAGADTTTAGLARELLDGWDAAPPEEEPLGLWREPSLPVPEPLPGFTEDALVLDEPALLALLTDIDTRWWLSAFRYERLLAALVATARAGGPEYLVRLIGRNVSPKGWCGFLTRLVVCLGDGTIVPGQGIRPAASPGGPLSFLAAQRARDVLGLLGELPCLLSTPTHEGFHISWEAFRERIGRFREAGVELVPTDVAVALARLDRTCAPRDVSDLDLPIRGVEVRLSGVLARWRDEPRPGVLRLSPAAEDDRPYLNRPVARLIADGDEPGTFGPLGLRNAWAERFHPDRRLYWEVVRDLPEAWPEPDPNTVIHIESVGDDGTEVHVRPSGSILYDSDSEAALMLLPAHPTRPAALVLQELGHNYPTDAVAGFLPIAWVAGRFGPVLSFVALAVISGAALKDRDRVAEALLTAWDEGRLRPGDLVDAWRSPWWDELNDMPRAKHETWPHSPAKTVTVLCTVADAGGLALAWPLLVTIAEELAGQRRTTAATVTALEAVLRYLPEVRAAGIAVDLPNVAALAARKGNSKAVTVARRIVELQRS